MHMACLPIPRHDPGEEFLRAADFPWRRVWYLDRLFADATNRDLAGLMILLHVANVFGLPALRSRPPPSGLIVERTPEIDLQGILLVSKLFGKIPGIAPERKFGTSGIGRATVTLFLVGRLQKGCGMLVSCPWKGR